MLSIMLTLSACTDTSTSTSTGEVVDDCILVTRVKTAITGESLSQAWEVEVEACRGVVQWNGFVDSEVQIQEFVGIAQGLDDVREVQTSPQVKLAS